MTYTQNRDGTSARLVFAATLVLTGAGAGAAAALATSGSGLIRVAGGAAGAIAGLCAAVWADHARKRRETIAAARRNREQVLDPVVSAPTHDLSILGLLLATRQDAAPFHGRSADLAWLQAWRDNPTSHPAALVTGPSGTGKTRLVTQFAASRQQSWAAGWLHPGRGASALAAAQACGDPTLILIDDADTSSDTAALLVDLAGQPQATQVRALLIARTADALAQVADQLPDSARWIIAPDNLPVLPIGAFGSDDDHARWFGEAARAYAVARRIPPPDLAITVTGGASTADEPILTIQAQALLAVLETERRRPQYLNVQSLPFDQVAEALFAHEQRRWQQAAQQPGWGLADLTAPVQQRAIAVLMLSGAATETDAVPALRAVPDLADATAERLAGIARWAFHLYPPGLVRIQPDMLAEWFVIRQLTSVPRLASRLTDLARHDHAALLTLLAHASDHMPAAIPLYVHLIQADPVGLAAVGADAALTARTGRPLLDEALASLIISPHWSPDALADLDRHLPKGALPRTRAAVSAATVRQVRDAGTRQDLAGALLRHGSDLRNLGCEREALTAYEETLSLDRDLAAADPTHQPELAKALYGYGATLWGLGRYGEALTAYEETLSLDRDLAAADPTHQPELARSLGGYADNLENLGRPREALAAFEEAVALHRDLAAADPSHQPELARSLDNLGVSLATLARHREALTTRDEAVALYRVLAKADPAHRAGLARAISNRGGDLYFLRRYQEARTAYEEALYLYREPAADNPAHQPGLAEALIGYSTSLWRLGRHGEALAACEKGVARYRDLAAANPKHQPKLANAVSACGSSLWALRRHQDAMAAFEEAVALHRDLAAANPRYQPELAKALTNYSISLRDQGRRAEGLTCDREALELYAVLARNDPDLYEETYKQLLSALRRDYDLRGDHLTSISLHLRRDNMSTD
jgi:tetratricopeptide (TPR) repeat protein